MGSEKVILFSPCSVVCPVCVTPEASAEERLNQSNIYISNLPPHLDEKWLRAELSRYGLITSAKLMMKNGVSKVCTYHIFIGNAIFSQGYGFVQFVKPEMAAAAINALHGAYIGDHCISCKLADKDKDRCVQNRPSNNLCLGWVVLQLKACFQLW